MASERPNIVLIVSDDQSYRDFGFMGNSRILTPHLDELASRSARYINGYVPTSVCRPSLATLLTGLYPHQHGIYFNHPPPGLQKLQQLSVAGWQAKRRVAEETLSSMATLPRILAQHGYSCLQTGKHWEGDFHNVGFTHGMTRGKPSHVALGNRRVADGLVAHGNGDAGLAIGRDTMDPIFDWIVEQQDRPFFVWYAPLLPHLPFDAGAEFVDPYEQSLADSPHLLGYYAQVSRFDATVGALLSFLRTRKLCEDTLVLLIIDNGFRPDSSGNRANERSKRSPFEDGVRTPILIHWEGRVQPATHAAVVQSIDVLPTILAAAGIARARDLPGIDLMPSALGHSTLASRPAFGEVYPNDATSLGAPQENVLARWVRDGDYKLILPATSASPLADGPLLFNLRRDPEEQRNLADAPDQRERIAHLTALLDAWWKPDCR